MLKEKLHAQREGSTKRARETQTFCYARAASNKIK